MKQIIAIALSAATFAAFASSADAAHRHRVCFVRHHHRVCHWVH